MRVDSLPPSVEMLRTCFRLKKPFSIKYRGGVRIRVDHYDDMWRITRYKDDREVSSFIADETGVEATDELVESMISSMFEAYKQHNPGEIDVPSFLTNALTVYGGKIAHINSVNLN